MSKNGRTRPSDSGILLFLVLSAGLVGAMNYGNNMAYLLVFLLFSLGLADFYQARRTLVGLQLLELRTQPAFAPEAVTFKLVLNESLGRPRTAVFLAVGPGEPAFCGPLEIEASGRTSLECRKQGLARGRYSFSGLHLLRFSPLGFFRTVLFLPRAGEFFVYPAPAGTQAWPPRKGGFREHGSENPGGDDFTGFRNYRPGEAQQHIDWKGVARGRPPLVKVFSGGGDQELWFDWRATRQSNPEERLSQLCRWVVEADRQETGFGLKLPDLDMAPAAGATHTHLCLAGLAVADTEKWS